MDICDLFKFPYWDDCKVHLASFSEGEEPLDVFVRDRDEWAQWHEYRSKKDQFNLKYICSLISYYHEKDMWLFGGFFKVTARHADRYEVELCPHDSHLVGRLLIEHKRVRARSRLSESISEMTLAQIFRHPYAGEAFCGFEWINHGFSALECIVRTSRPDWKAALENVKGVYLIVDTSNARKYVGAAYGAGGVWARLTSYMETGHGGNEELVQLIGDNGIDYARRNFKFTLLDYRPIWTDDQALIDRECFWKNVLLTRGCTGYNRN